MEYDYYEVGRKHLDGVLAAFYRTRTQTRSTPTTPIDPQKVAVQAQQYQAEQLKAGHEISATEAVAHVMAQNK